MPQLISLEPDWFVKWVSACDVVSGPAMTFDEALTCLRRRYSGNMDDDLCEVQVQRIVLRAAGAREEWRENVARFNRNGPKGGTAHLETIIAESHKKRTATGGE